MKKILIIEDDSAIVKGIEAALCDGGYQVDSASDGEAGYKKAAKNNYDLILLDLNLPLKNGFDICRDLRADKVFTPVLMLTSRNDEIDKILGLELGADDYLTKPFSIRELEARIKALIRRSHYQEGEKECFDFDGIHIDFKKQEASAGKKKLDLTVREFSLLKYLIDHSGCVITRSQLLDDVWGYNSFPSTRTVDNYILSLRKKIENNPSEPKHILTVHTAGYKFVP
ncbi:MAG: response regulator transcription factor [Syntrophothermus sp.]